MSDLEQAPIPAEERHDLWTKRIENNRAGILTEIFSTKPIDSSNPHEVLRRKIEEAARIEKAKTANTPAHPSRIGTSSATPDTYRRNFDVGLLENPGEAYYGLDLKHLTEVAQKWGLNVIPPSQHV